MSSSHRSTHHSTPGSPAPPAAGRGWSGADFSGVDEVLRRAVARGEAPGVVAALTDRRGIVHEGAFGAAATAASLPMRADTVFRVASMTKPVTTIAVMMLHEDGKLGLDDPLARHLPGFEQPGVLESFDGATGKFTVRDAARAITIRDLLTHTSGFGYWFLDPEVLQEANGRIDYFRAPFLMHDPGAKFSYGISTDILGGIVEPLSGLPLERFLERRIAGPLGMRATGFDVPADATRLATLHRRRGAAFVDSPNEAQGEAPRGGGGLYTTAADYLSLLRMLLNHGRLDDGGRLLSERGVAEMTANQIGPLMAQRQTTALAERTLDFEFMDGTQKFGFGFLIETRDRQGGRHAGSYGWGGIFNTYFWVDPVAEIAAVLLMQLSPFCDPGCIGVYRAFERAVYAAVDATRTQTVQG